VTAPKFLGNTELSQKKKKKKKKKDSERHGGFHKTRSKVFSIEVLCLSKSKTMKDRSLSS
jgi:hypothetical protein